MRIRLESIMCTTDFSDEANRAIPYAVALAKEYDARLYIAHVVDISNLFKYWEGMMNLEEEEKRIADAAREDLREIMEGQDVEWGPLIAGGHVGTELARMARDRRVDLVVSATHGRSGLKRVILGSVCSRLMRKLPCPLLAIPCREEAGPGPVEIRFERILVGCDFSPDSHLAVQFGLSLAQEFESQLHLVHVVETNYREALLEQPPVSAEEIPEDLRDMLRGMLSDLVPEEARTWCEPVMSLRIGRTDEELIRYARSVQGDLMVLGMRGRSMAESLLVGATTERVLRQATWPVLCIRPMVPVD